MSNNSFCSHNCPRCVDSCKFHWSYPHHELIDPEDVCAAGICYESSDCDYCTIPCKNRELPPYSPEHPYHTNMGPLKLSQIPDFESKKSRTRSRDPSMAKKFGKNLSLDNWVGKMNSFFENHPKKKRGIIECLKK